MCSFRILTDLKQKQSIQKGERIQTKVLHKTHLLPPKKLCCSSETITNKSHCAFYDAERFLKVFYHFPSSSQATEETDTLLYVTEGHNSADTLLVDEAKQIASTTIQPGQTLANIRLVCIAY